MMHVLIVEDDFVSRKLLHRMLSPYGECDIVVNGIEAVEAFKLALEDGHPYDLVCMDIMMPRMDGQEALGQIRQLEAQKCVHEMNAAKVVMTTAVDDNKQVTQAFYKGGAASYFIKPIDQEKLIAELRVLGLIT
jgi:two-component system, chemotaxis family, chemotaxis protein CheY